MTQIFPTKFSEIDAWAKKHRESSEWTLQRFITFAVLDCVYSIPEYAPLLVLRGSGAISFHCPGFRPANDLDFMHIQMKKSTPVADREAISKRINSELEKNLVKHFHDYEQWRKRLQRDIHVDVMPMEYQPFYVQRMLPPPSSRPLHILELECCVMDKIFGLLAQPRAKNHRPRDLLDLAAIIWRHNKDIRKQRLVDYYFHRTSRVDQDIVLASTSFNEEIRNRSYVGYADAARALNSKITFDRAWTILLDFINEVEAATTLLDNSAG